MEKDDLRPGLTDDEKKAVTWLRHVTSDRSDVEDGAMQGTSMGNLRALRRAFDKYSDSLRLAVGTHPTQEEASGD